MPVNKMLVLGAALALGCVFYCTEQQWDYSTLQRFQQSAEDAASDQAEGKAVRKVAFGLVAAVGLCLLLAPPGTILLLKLAQLSHHERIHLLDMGKNNMPYKASFATNGFPVARGIVAAHPVAAAANCTLRLARSCSRSPLLAKPYAKLADWLRPFRTREAFR